VLSVFLAAATTKVEGVDGGPPRGCWRQVWHRSPPKLKMSMVGPLGGAGGRSGSATTEVEDVDDGPSSGVLVAGPAVTTTEVEDVDSGPPGGC
jgi:hypothetical protein